MRAVIVGAGFGGLGAARALREAGVEDVVVLERADATGGVWRDNTYPDAACVVPSPLYSWSWAPNPGWGRRYSRQPEILAYLRDAAAREGLLDLVVTGQDVAEVVLDEVAATWTVRTRAGQAYGPTWWSPPSASSPTRSCHRSPASRTSPTRPSTRRTGATTST